MNVALPRPLTPGLLVLSIAVLLAGCASSPTTGITTPTPTTPGSADPTASSVAPLPNASIVPSPLAPPLALPGSDGIVRITLVAKEVPALLADGVGYDFWTFGGTVPGPMLRVREGDTVNLTLTNDAASEHVHSIDLHAVTGPGGGAKVMQVNPGHSRSFQFKAVHPGDYVYHCATPPVEDHVANGMYGMIVVEPRAGLPHADREFYVMQGETYTQQPLGTKGIVDYSREQMLNETPTYVTFNGRVGALTGAGALTANVNDTVRIFFGVGGAVPSSFHVIGEIFDRVMMDGNPPTFENRQTVLVPAAGAATFEFTTEYPGTYLLVDHTLARAFERGALGMLMVSGPADATIFSGTTTPGSGH
ncbi:MAG: multicopper oxidase domain-containing protein [Thermoplasmatota archaeon]